MRPLLTDESLKHNQTLILRRDELLKRSIGPLLESLTLRDEIPEGFKPVAYGEKVVIDESVLFRGLQRHGDSIVEWYRYDPKAYGETLSGDINSDAEGPSLLIRDTSGEIEKKDFDPFDIPHNEPRYKDFGSW